MNGSKISTKIAISKISFGSSFTDKNNLFSALSLDVTSLAENAVISFSKMSVSQTGDSLMKRDGSYWNFTLLNSIGVGIDDIGFDFVGGSKLSTSVSATMSLPFNCDINLPYVSLGAHIDDTPFAAVSFGLALTGNTPTVKASFLVDINDSDSLASHVSKISEDILNDVISTQKFGVDSIILGASASDTMTGFSKVSANISAETILKPIKEVFKSILSVDLLSLTTAANATIENIKIGAAAGRNIVLESLIIFQSKIPVKISGIGFVGLSLGLDDTSIMSLEVPSEIDLSPGLNKLPIFIKALFPSSETIQEKVGTFSRNIQDHLGSTSEKLFVTGLTVGHDSGSSLQFLSKGLFKIASSYLFNPKTFEFFTNLLLSSPISFSDLEVSSITLGFIEKTINAGLTGSTNSSISIDIDLPFVSLGSSLDKTDAFDIAVSGLKVGGKGPLALQSAVGVKDSEELSDKIKNVFDAAIYGTEIPGSLGIKKLGFGISSSDYIDSFSKIVIDFGLKGVIGPLLSGSFNTSTILDKVGISPRGVEISSLPGKSIKADLTAGLNNGLALNITGLGYIGINLGLDHIDILSVSGSIDNIIQGQNDLKLQTFVNFPSSDVIQNKVGSFADDLQKNGVGHTPQNITAGSLTFGSSKDNSFLFLSKAKLSFRSSSIITSDFIALITKALGLSSSILNDFALTKAHINGETDPQSLLVDLGLDLKNVSLSVGLDLGYAGLALDLNDHQ